jgi:hypothetical protein
MRMALWTGRLVILGALLLWVGWVLVLLSNHANSTGGSELVWRIGGLMVYAAYPTFVLVPVAEVLSRLRSRGIRREA